MQHTYMNYVKSNYTYLLGWDKPDVKQPSYMAAQTVSFKRTELLDNMENNLFHVQRTTLSNKCGRNIIAT